jgi:hypothetical protein
MKKFFSIIALGAMTLSLSSFEIPIENDEACQNYAENAADAEMNAYPDLYDPNSNIDFISLYMYWYGACQSSGGTLLPPPIVE